MIRNWAMLILSQKTYGCMCMFENGQIKPPVAGKLAVKEYYLTISTIYDPTLLHFFCIKFMFNSSNYMHK